MSIPGQISSLESRSSRDVAAARRQTMGNELRQGGLCPVCQVERLDYDGLLNLTCPKCGVLSGGCFT